MARAPAVDIPRLDAIEGWPPPEAQQAWFGDRRSEQVLVEAYRSRRMHHAWLIGGPKGIGKATLAYRLARFVLSFPDPRADEVAAAEDLSLPADTPASRLLAARAHPNLLVLERAYREDRKRFLTELGVDQIRRTVSFFGSTSAEPGWRIALVDPADEMSPSAANALLKVLEEPPPRSLFLIISHAPGRLLPTIRSRCRQLDLAPLAHEAIAAAIRANSGDTQDAEDLGLAAVLAEGSLRRAILLLQADGIPVYRQFARFTARLPEVPVDMMHELADAVTRRDDHDSYTMFVDMVRGWLGRRVRREPEPGGQPGAFGTDGVPLARWADVWEKITETSAAADDLNLDRKQVVLSILMSLANATRM